MGKLWTREKDDSGHSRLQEVNLSTLKIEQPTVIYLSGFLTVNKKPGYIAGGIKMLEELFEDQPALSVKPALMAWSHKNLASVYNLAAYDTHPGSRVSQPGLDLAAGIILPLVAKNFSVAPGGKVLSGEALPVDEARANLRNITFMGYSAGAIAAQETFNAALRLMSGVGIPEAKARDLLHEVVLVTAGDFSRPSKQTDRFTSIHMAATNDRLTRFKNWVFGPAGTALRTIFDHDAAKKLMIRPLSDTCVFVSAPARPTYYTWEYDGDGNRTAKKPFAPLYHPWMMRHSYHEIPHYMTTDEHNNGFANIALYALINAVNRRQKPDTALQLLEPPPLPTVNSLPLWKQQEREEYRAKITAALPTTMQ